MSILLGTGDGSFSQPMGSPYGVGQSPFAVAVGDFNGDGHADLAVANEGSDTVTILLGDGSGHFTTATGSPIAVGDNPFGLAVGDFNGDGIADLAVANESSNTVTHLAGGRHWRLRASSGVATSRSG